MSWCFIFKRISFVVFNFFFIFFYYYLILGMAAFACSVFLFYYITTFYFCFLKINDLFLIPPWMKDWFFFSYLSIFRRSENGIVGQTCNLWWILKDTCLSGDRFFLSPHYNTLSLWASVSQYWTDWRSVWMLLVFFIFFYFETLD